MADDLVRSHVVVTGLVQGVFFRHSLKLLAEHHGIAGWARNTADGAVEAVFEGPETSVIEMVVFCREGPPRARVESMHSTSEPPEGIEGFSIR